MNLNTPYFIIGAGRSGTNILRDILTSNEKLITWPCDEINLIFRHGNIDIEHDEFGADQANPNVIRFIRTNFAKLQRSNTNAQIVEKTCANSLRVPFIDKIFPEAKYLLILRDGFDVTSSATKRWKASIEIKYLIKKLQFVPISDIPFYTWRFLLNRLHQLKNNQKTQREWGPRYIGMRDDVKQYPIDIVCAKQWAVSVKKAYLDLQHIPQQRVYAITYEDLVNNPAETISEIFDWMEIKQTSDELFKKAGTISRKSLGGGRSLRDSSEIREIIEPVMNQFYDKVAKNK